MNTNSNEQPEGGKVENLRVWIAPKVQQLAAGSAEDGVGSQADGGQDS